MTPLDSGPPFGPVVNGTMVVVFWEYRPSNIAAYLFLSLFALATLGHFVYFVWLRSWTFIPLLLGGICEAPSLASPARHLTSQQPGQVFGYLERARAHLDPTALDPWLLQNMLLLVSPPLLAAALYMSYGRISSALLEGTNRPSPRRKRNCCGRCCYAWYVLQLNLDGTPSIQDTTVLIHPLIFPAGARARPQKLMCSSTLPPSLPS